MEFDQNRAEARKARFIRLLKDQFRLADIDLQPEVSLVGDLEFDSFDFLRLVVIADSVWPGMEVPDQLSLESITIGDVLYYAENSVQVRGDEVVRRD